MSALIPATDGRVGGWWISVNSTGMVTTPTLPMASGGGPLPVTGGMGGGMALHFAGKDSDAVKGWGADASVALFKMGDCYDASVYATGIELSLMGVHVGRLLARLGGANHGLGRRDRARPEVDRGARCLAFGVLGDRLRCLDRQRAVRALIRAQNSPIAGLYSEDRRPRVSCRLAAVTFPVLPGAEPWSSHGTGERARVGILLSHGFTGSPASLRPLAEMLARRGFGIELVRLPGHGTHFRDMMSTRYEDWSGEVRQGLGRLSARCERVIGLGLSMGGTLVLDVVSQDPSLVSGVVTINAPVLDREGLLVKLAPFLEHVLPLVPASAAGLSRNDIAKPGMNEQAYAWVPAKAGNSLVREFPRIRAQLKNVTCPALIAYSRADHSVPPENSKAILRALGSKDVTELPLERSYHVATLDYDLELIEERVTAFADRVTQG